MKTQTIGPLDVVRLTPLTAKTDGRPEITVGLIDGPVFLTHPDLAGQNINDVPGKLRGNCARAGSTACLHDTFVAGILCARRGSAAPASCPGCTFLVRPIYAETDPAAGGMTSATPEELAEAIVDCANAGARALNLSSVLTEPALRSSHDLGKALDHAASRGVIAVAAAGNQGLVGNSVITRHPAVVPVAACDLQGRLLSESNLGRSIGRRGLMAPWHRRHEPWNRWRTADIWRDECRGAFRDGNNGAAVVGVSARGYAHIRLAVLQAWSARRRTIAPPLLDAGQHIRLLAQLMLERYWHGEEKHSETKTDDRKAHQVRLPGFLVEEEIGLGDAIKRATYAVGIKPCGGCEKRAAATVSALPAPLVAAAIVYGHPTTPIIAVAAAVFAQRARRVATEVVGPTIRMGLVVGRHFTHAFNNPFGGYAYI